MTPRVGGPSVSQMKNRIITPYGLIILALTAVVSLASGHLVDLGEQLLGSGPPSTPALLGDAAGLIACAVSAWFGVRALSRMRTC
jgi:hypothetical protein